MHRPYRHLAHFFTRDRITDEEVAEAERNMDALYLREHGELPDKTRSDDAKAP